MEKYRKVRRMPNPILLKVILIGISVLLIVCIAWNIVTVQQIKSRTVEFGLKDIGELVTQAGHYTNVQVIKENSKLFGIDIPLTQSKYIYSYDGIIKAGYNFSEIDLNIDAIGHKVIVVLPEVKILSNMIDENSLEVYDEKNNIFHPLNLEKVNLSLVELKNESREKAIQNGLLEEARENAERMITAILAGALDLQEYTIEFK